MFEEFLAANTWSKLEETEEAVEIIDPWGDSSLRLRIPRSQIAEANQALDHLILLPRFTGIFHRDRNELEFFYVVLGADDKLLSTTFTFRWDGADYQCGYRQASDRASALVGFFRPTGRESETDYRGLQRFALMRSVDGFPGLTEDMKKAFARLVPTSFFVGGVTDIRDELLVKLAKHLNFFMSYFWRDSPSVLVHEKNDAATPYSPATSSASSIPSVINASDLDSFLLDLSLAARGGGNRLRFLYYYQILEYAAFYWTEDSVKTGVRRILMNPDLQSRLDDYVPRLIETLVPTRQNDDYKIRKVVEAAVDPAIVWTEIHANIACFSTKLEFDGGFNLEPVVTKDTTAAAFAAMWTPKIVDACRSIRNALAHAREMRMEAVIAPTSANESRLAPWIPVIRRIAERVVLSEAQTEA